MDFDKDRLWTAYSEAATKINAKRKGLLNGPLYKQMQALVFDTAYAALLDTVNRGGLWAGGVNEGEPQIEALLPARTSPCFSARAFKPLRELLKWTS